jgi:hypothetical protein
MKGLVLALTLVSSVSVLADTDVEAMDRASQFVFDTMTRGREILERKSNGDRINGMCGLVKQKAGSAEIGAAWLGDFNRLPRERNAVKTFYGMVPSIIMTKVISAIGGGGGGGSVDGSFAVNPRAVPRGNNVYGVGLTVSDGKGNSYNGTVVTYGANNKWKIIDVEYMGFSAVSYIGRDFQEFLRREYNADPSRSMPVSALIRSLLRDRDYVRCP